MLVEWAVVVRPQMMPPDGSTVHDELIYVWAEDAKRAIRLTAKKRQEIAKKAARASAKVRSRKAKKQTAQ